MHVCVDRLYAYILLMYISGVDNFIRINEYCNIYSIMCTVHNVHLPPIDSYKFRCCWLQKAATRTHSVTMFDATPVTYSASGAVHYVHRSLCIRFVSLFTPNKSMVGELLLSAHEDSEGSILVNPARAHPAKCIWSMPRLFFFLLLLFCGQTPWVHLWHTWALGGIKEYIIIHNRWVL